MNEKDAKILMAVAAERTRSPDRIHETTGIPTSTVHYRIERMREKGIIKNDLLETDLDTLGLNLTIVSDVWTEFGEGYEEEIGQQIADIDGVNQVYFTMGDTDFVVIAHLPNQTSLQDLIRSYESIDGIQRTSSKSVISTIKRETRPIQDTPIEKFIEE